MDETQVTPPTPEKKAAGQKSLIWGLVVLIVLALGYMLFKPGKNTEGVLPNQAGANNTANTQQENITGTEFSFSPSTFTVKKGRPVNIVFRNDGKYPHNLTIGSLNVATKTIDPGSRDTVTFTPQNSGQFQFSCTVPGHADRGMVGMMTVE